MNKRTPTEDITCKDLLKHLDKLKITARQKEFVKAAIRSLTRCVLEERFGAKVDM